MKLETNLDKAKRRLERSLKMLERRVNASTRAGLHAWANYTKALVISKNLSGRPGLNVVTGKLIKSLKHRVRGNNLSNFQVEIFFSRTIAPYAHVHEYGATIRPKRKKFLRFPVPKHLGSTIAKRWVFAKEVTIPPRLNFVKTVKKTLRLLKRHVANEIKKRKR